MAGKRDEEKVTCHTPTPGKASTRIARWKYELVRGAIRKVVPRNAMGMSFRKLTRQVRKTLTATQLKEIGSLMWYVTTVKLHMETLGELERVPGMVPQHLRLRK